MIKLKEWTKLLSKHKKIAILAHNADKANGLITGLMGYEEEEAELEKRLKDGTFTGGALFKRGLYPMNNKESKMICVGMMLDGYCKGYFGRDSYEDKRIEAFGVDWIIARQMIDSDSDRHNYPQVAIFENMEERNEFIKECSK